MKKILYWLIPILLIIAIPMDVLLYMSISRACIPSYCEEGTDVILWQVNEYTVCTTDCGGDRSYLIVWIIGIVAIGLLTYWILLLKDKRESSIEQGESSPNT